MPTARLEVIAEVLVAQGNYNERLHLAIGLRAPLVRVRARTAGDIAEAFAGSRNSVAIAGAWRECLSLVLLDNVHKKH